MLQLYYKSKQLINIDTFIKVFYQLSDDIRHCSDICLANGQQNKKASFFTKNEKECFLISYH
ncbi:hypothetical protein FC82_GL003259 [Secundilactobacillus collinoides DSM 20515 = JCM 1123]|uniref:Uncharacterized protein n=1 Tax=Secundilactobacillus collinoides DSM 20515 = JCM 1123 TaxID=1423733 RepID=A0A0R2B610_SECCO|nr:hypothetical protein FC82_GL003259 [Secundilactobacillus collinoides DSM 20515 = JCM 1123]